MFTVLFGNRFLIMFWLDVCSLKPTTASAPASPVLVSKPRPLSMALPSSNSSLLGSPTISTDAPKKRRAPQPPILVSQSCTSDPRTRQRLYSEPNVRLHGDQVRPLLTWCVWYLSKPLTKFETDKIKGDVFYFWALIKIKMFFYVGVWPESWVVSRVFTEENQTQGAASSCISKCSCSRTCFSRWKCARFGLLFTLHWVIMKNK